MPAPAVYLVAVVGTVAVGVAFKELVFDPYISPRLEQWRDEFRARRQAARSARAPRAVAPHFTHEGHRTSDDDAAPSDDGSAPSGDDEAPSIEMRSFGPNPSSVSSELRHRRARTGGLGRSTQSGMIDESIADIPYAPIAPTPVSWRASSSVASPRVSPPQSPQLPQSPFAVGSETATLTSPRSSPPQVSPPQLHISPMHSPTTSFPLVQLPTPSETPATLPRVLSPQPPRSPEHLNIVAPPMHSIQASTSSSLSFNTALSPQSDFRSFPPTQPTSPTSPFSDSLILSGDDEMYSFSSHSAESLMRFDDGVFSVSNSEHSVHEELSDSSSEGYSESSWQDVADPPHH